MNDIKILGRLTDTPEIKRSASGRDYAWFTVAVPRRNNKDEADFIRCVAFDKRQLQLLSIAEKVVRYCAMGAYKSQLQSTMIQKELDIIIQS